MPKKLLFLAGGLLMIASLFWLSKAVFAIVVALIIAIIALGLWIKGGAQRADASIPKSLDGPAFRTFDAAVPGSPLKLRHFISQPEEINVSSSLIMGEREIICVTSQGMKYAAERLADEIEETGLELTYVYLDHAHLDHSQGASVLIERFPNAKFVGHPRVAALQRHRMDTEDKIALQRYAENAAVPSIPFEGLDTDRLTVDGREIQLWHNYYGDVALGEPDEPHTVLYIPDLKALLPTDICYFGGHVMLGGTTPESRAKWKEQLLDWMKLDLEVVIPGHIPRDWSPQMTPMGVLRFTHDYIEAYETVLAECDTSDEVINAMLRKYPDIGHISSVYIGTYLLFRETHRLMFNKRIEKIASLLPRKLVRKMDIKMFEARKKASNFPKEV